jgi:hypothetical protein
MKLEKLNIGKGFLKKISLEERWSEKVIWEK